MLDEALVMPSSEEYFIGYNNGYGLNNANP